jgi:hypothetical protein
MSKQILFGVAVLVASLSGFSPDPSAAAAQSGSGKTKPKAPAKSGAVSKPTPAPPVLHYTEVARLSRKTRQAVFVDVTACHADVKKKAEDQFPEMKLGPGYSSKRDAKMFRERSRFENAGSAACDQRMIQKHTLDAVELREIKVEGICKQWPPLTGKLGC